MEVSHGAMVSASVSVAKLDDEACYLGKNSLGVKYCYQCYAKLNCPRRGKLSGG